MDHHPRALARVRGEDQAALWTGNFEELPSSVVFAGVPWRQFKSYRGQRHFSGFYWAATTRSLVPYESLLEQARLLLADFDTQVSQLAAQPFYLTIERENDKPLRRIPDFLLGRVDGVPLVVDVKQAKACADPLVAEALELTGRAVRGRGWDYEIWTGVCAQALANLRFMAGYRRPEVIDVAAVNHLRRALRAPQPCTLGDLELRLLQAGFVDPRPPVMHLLWRSELHIDLEAPLDRLTKVSW